MSEVGVHWKETEESYGFPFNQCVEWNCVVHGAERPGECLVVPSCGVALRLEETLGVAAGAPVLPIWEQDGVEATPRKLAKGTREEVTELVVDAPVVQVLPEPQVQVSLRLPFSEQIVDVPVPPRTYRAGGRSLSTSNRAARGSGQEVKPRPNLAEHQGADTRGSRAAVDRTCGGCAEDRFSRQNPARAVR